jgi:hypothetical protein
MPLRLIADSHPFLSLSLNALLDYLNLQNNSLTSALPYSVAKLTNLCKFPILHVLFHNVLIMASVLIAWFSFN